MLGTTHALGAILGVMAIASPPAALDAGNRGDTISAVRLPFGAYVRRGGNWTRRDAGVDWDVRADRFTVRLREGSRRDLGEVLDAACGDDGIWNERRRQRLGFVDVSVQGIDAVELCRRLSTDPDVESAVPAAIGRWMDAGDPFFEYQWHLKNTGQESQGTPGADLDIRGAWAFESGDTGVAIAFLDSPVRVDHPDLVHAFVANPGEIAGNGLDDDDNGFIDDVHGWNFGTNSPTVHSDGVDAFHGTRVVGIAVARAGNGISVAGVAGGSVSRPGCRAIHVVIGVDSPDASVIDDAILYAVDRGARVIAMTFAVPADPAILAAIETARAHDVLMVAPAGNQLAQVPFPANHPAVMAVGGTDRDDHHWGVSTAGPPIEIAAPATMIRTTDTAWPLWTVSGTSYAVPQVAAVAALVMSWADCLDADTVRALLRSTAHDVDAPGWDPRTGWGRLDAAAAVSSVATAVMPACRCREDLDGDGTVDGADLGLLLRAWGTDDPLADLHADGTVDGIDLGRWVMAQGVCR